MLGIERLAVVVGLVGLVGLMGPGDLGARETITFDPAPREREAPRPEREARPLIPEKRVFLILQAEGRWPAELEAEGTASLMSDWVGGWLSIDGEEHRLAFQAPVAEGTLGHVSFSDLDGRLRTGTGFGGPGSNYLTQDGRDWRSRGPGSLVNRDGFMRVDRRNDGLVIRFSIDAEYCFFDVALPMPDRTAPLCEGPGVLFNRHEGSTRVTGCIASLDSLAADPDACLTPFQIDHVTPQDKRENVAFDDPGVSVTFSEPIRLDTLEEAFSLFTLSPEDELLRITGSWEEVAASRYRFTPEESLYSGTIYIVQIQGGEDGVRSRDGSDLEDDWFVSTFTTMLDLVAQAPQDAPTPELPSPLNPVSPWAPEGKAPVVLHNFQVVRDARLTAGKPTLTRAHFHWEKHEDVAADMQPDRFRMEIETSAAYQRRVGQLDRAVGNVMWIYRSDSEVFNADDRRHARHTANFFGWRPSRGEDHLRWVVRPYDPYPHAIAQTEHEVEREIRIWDFDPPRMELYYTFARVGSWRRRVPASVRDFAARAMRMTASEVPSFFPHREASAHRLPPLPRLRDERLLYDRFGNPIDTRNLIERARGWIRDRNSGPDEGDQARPNLDDICAMANDRMPAPPPRTPDRDIAHGIIPPYSQRVVTGRAFTTKQERWRGCRT